MEQPFKSFKPFNRCAPFKPLKELNRSDGSTSCYVDVKSPNTRMLFFLMTLLLPRPKRDLLLCVARHTAVTLTRNAPLSKAQSPGLSVSANEPSGVFDFSRFC
jgi:hypothetical protein